MKRLVLLAVMVGCLAAPLPAEPLPPIEDYINRSWEFLERNLQDLPAAAVDPKLGDRERYPVYLAPGESLESVQQRLDQELTAEQLERVELRTLPPDVLSRPQLEGDMESHGLLYLPHPYVVPGGRFNEMYGWDSYFINLGLLESGRVEQARLMVENHLYQVRHYGRVLNANRTYYLTRSQPPFLATMVADVYDRTGDVEWVERALPALIATYRFWTSEPHLTPQTGLSRYYDLGEGAAPEVLESEKDESGHTHYDRIRSDFKQYARWSETEQMEKLGYPLSLYYDSAADELTPLFYKGDRSMRESGYDPSDRFGRFNIDVIHYNPVDLNSLLYLYELDMGRLFSQMRRPGPAADWFALAAERKQRMQRYLWDEESGLFLDYNFRTESRRDYPFATTYFPLWTGWSTPGQAAAVAANRELFLKPGGIVTSTHRSGNQWDSPFGWAPLQMVAAEGLAGYGYARQAAEIAQAFLSLVEQEYQKSGTIVEKYDVVNRTSNVSEGIEYGYSSNEIGFGWTNAVYLRLQELLP
ncbi:MAG: trehalase family glycosidase [Vulcanimicrobiota bacterium]